MGEAYPTVALLAFALVSTVAVELPLAFAFFGVRGWRALAVVALSQVATNPAVELLCISVHWRASLSLSDPAWPILLAAELVATGVEALLYRTASVTSHPWLMSCTLNLASFAVGLLLA
ncbi:MAG: hypothetical protein IKF14_02885 [Atopobiaceae bacterium]|nr:hypothetical protein [Atopobiaceae bacterium]